jgi:sugar-specific transcriptional regulator TrmB
MIVQESFLSKLKDFGLNIYESKLWTALLSRGISTAGELSDIANIPRSRSYDVLESLERKGFIVLKLGKPIKYLAVPPEEVLERVKKRIRDDASKQVTAMEELRDSEVLDELQLLHKQGVEFVEPTELTGSIKGRSHLYDQAEMSIKSAEQSIFIMTTPEGFIRDMPSFKPIFEKAAKRGVTIRVATTITQECHEIIEDLGDLADVRHIEHIQARFVIVDGKEILFMLLDDREVHPTYDVGIWVNTSFFAQAMEGLINEVWDKMERAKDLLVIQK